MFESSDLLFSPGRVKQSLSLEHHFLQVIHHRNSQSPGARSLLRLTEVVGGGRGGGGVAVVWVGIKPKMQQLGYFYSTAAGISSPCNSRAWEGAFNENNHPTRRKA